MNTLKMEGFLDEVQSRLIRHSKYGPNGILIDGMNRLRVPVPVVRRELKDPYSFFNSSPADLIKTWDYIWNQSEIFEVMSQALYFYQGKSLCKEQFETILAWVDRCACWEHSDDLSKILSLVVEENPGWVLPAFERWNRSENLWKRRQSIVGLIEYASKRKRVLAFDHLISFVDPLIHDDEYYVQKGVGWTLREIYNLYPDQTLEYFSRNLERLSSIAYSSATSKLEPPIKKILNSRRKNLRKKS